MRVCLILATLALTFLVSGQGRRGNRWAKYEYEMQNPVDDPADAWVEGEFAFARLRYRSNRGGFGRRRGYDGRWGTDANKSERQFMMAVRRLTRIQARSIEEVVDVDSDEMYNWPFLYAVGIGDWRLSESHVVRLRNFFERGGFFMVDDFHNEGEWADFMEGMRRVLPNATLVELQDDDSINHVVYDLKERYHIPGLQIVRGQEWERGGIGGHYRALLDEKGRVQVAACFNMDLGDAWEWADYPEYPEKYSSLAFRIGINYILYSMTH